MDLNVWGIIGLCYVVFWNIIGFVSFMVLRKIDKKAWVYSLVVAVATIPPFLFGLFGSG